MAEQARPEWMPTDEERAEAMRYMSPYSIPYQEHTVMIRLAQRKLVEYQEQMGMLVHEDGSPKEDCPACRLRKEVGLDG